jgi:hypothetical protein
VGGGKLPQAERMEKKNVFVKLALVFPLSLLLLGAEIQVTQDVGWSEVRMPESVQLGLPVQAMGLLQNFGPAPMEVLISVVHHETDAVVGSATIALPAYGRQMLTVSIDSAAYVPGPNRFTFRADAIGRDDFPGNNTFTVVVQFLP